MTYAYVIPGRFFVSCIFLIDSVLWIRFIDSIYCNKNTYRSSIVDLANAPPLFDGDQQGVLNGGDMYEVTPSGEKRKATPPDLLTLSHMYFEKNQVNYTDQGFFLTPFSKD